MKKTTLILLSTLALLLIVLGVAYAQKSSTSASVVNNTPTPTVSTPTTNDTASTPVSTTPTTQPTTPSGYTLAIVATHNNASSCWTAINGNVYDVTAWINQHPGGSQPILSLCGTDGSAAFNAQHGGERRPANELAGFRIGALAN